ncbi:hypothetical protein NSU08_05960 [Paenibacillus sp. FSL H7-0331]|uniref:hypothetical protein n=2 Tax=Paenibacillus sp. FSL H7-0331 TaxID=1920421 RepID=UPI00096CEBA3|nr:hypothetical protein BK127_20545 [Paenibacillus sp. FSL H7-0331]
MKALPIRFMISISAALISVSVFMSVTGCGGKKAEQQSGNQQKAQGQQQSGKPIDSALKEQMNMYKDIKQYEFQESEKLRKSNKDQLKKLQKDQSESSSQTSDSSQKQKSSSKDASKEQKGSTNKSSKDASKDKGK